MAERPRLVEEANRLKEFHQAGKEDECYEATLSCLFGINEVMTSAEDRKDSRLVTFSAMQVAALAERVGWLEADRIKKDAS